MQFPRLRYNIIALGALRGTNYLIPLIAIPYLTRVLGADAFGKYTFVQVIMQTFILLIDYGFSLTATRDISANRKDNNTVSKIFSTVWMTQWFLGFISFLCLLGLLLIIPSMQDDLLIYIGGFTMVLGQVLLPLWLLEGLENMKAVALIQALGRLSVLPFLFFVVDGSDDTFWAVTIMGLGMVCAGILSLFWIAYKRMVVWQFPTFADVFIELKRGFELFFSRALQKLFYIITAIVLNSVSGAASVGYFNLADKLRGAAQALLQPVSQAMFPRMCHLYKHDRPEADALIKRSFVLIISLAGLATLVLWAGADPIIYLIAGPEFKPVIPVLQWLAFAPLLAGFSIVFGIQIMLPNHMNRRYNQIVIGGTLASIICMVILVNVSGAVGAAVATVFQELAISVVMGWYLTKKGFLLVSRD